MLKIREAKKEDIPQIFEIIRTTWLATYPNAENNIQFQDIVEQYSDKEKTIAEWQNNQKKPEGRTFLVAELDKQLVGEATYKNSEPAKISSFYVLPDFQNQGIGSKIMEFILKDIGEKDIYLFLAIYNAAGARFYEKFGFKKQSASTEVFNLRNGKTIPIVKMYRKYRQ